MTTPHVFAYPNLPSSFEQAVLPVDKQSGWTSFDVIRKLRPIIQVRKIGHAGTLDPLATGLLICLVGRATRSMELFMQLPKTYTGIFRLGATTPSYDAETAPESIVPTDHITNTMLENASKIFVGEIAQKPPMYSAVKVKGERLYKKARRGEHIERPARKVTISTFELTGRQNADVSFRIECSKGTYIRALAHARGQILGCGAYLTSLRRTAIGDISVDQAWTLDKLKNKLDETH